MPPQEKPITAYPSVELEEQDQEGGPGFDSELKPAANFTQLEFWSDDAKPYLQEYEGRGLLKDKAVLITGGDSGIGRSVAILMAREGADISIVYLPEEERDAQWTKRQVEKAGRRANLMSLNLREEDNCKKAVEGHVKAFGKLNVLVNNSTLYVCPLRVQLAHTGSPTQARCRRSATSSVTSTLRPLRKPTGPTCSPCLP